MIVLASKSPRRQALLRREGIPFRLLTADTDESYSGGIGAEALVRMLAERKADAVSPLCGETDIVIAADTVVSAKGRILGKPKDRADACKMLRFLSGSEQSVFTGVCLSSSSKKVIFTEESVVVFRPLSDKEIADYVENEKPFDKAGAYAVQEGGGGFVSELRGDYDNVVGLPVFRVIEKLREEFGWMPTGDGKGANDEKNDRH